MTLSPRSDLIQMEIDLDESKIIREGKYALEEVYDKLKEVLESEGLRYDGVSRASGYGIPQDYAYCINVILELEEEEWFMPYVKKWHWHTEHGCNDVLEHFTRKAKKAKSYDYSDIMHLELASAETKN